MRQTHQQSHGSSLTKTGKKMIKNITKLEFQVGEKIYQFLCENDSPLEHAKIAVMEFTKYLDNVIAMRKAQETPKLPDQPPTQA